MIKQLLFIYFGYCYHIKRNNPKSYYSFASHGYILLLYIFVIMLINNINLFIILFLDFNQSYIKYTQFLREVFLPPLFYVFTKFYVFKTMYARKIYKEFYLLQEDIKKYYFYYAMILLFGTLALAFSVIEYYMSYRFD